MGPPNPSAPRRRKYRARSITPPVAVSLFASGAKGFHLERLEIRDRIRLGPDADLARIGKRLVPRIDHLFPVPVDLEPIPAGIRPKLMPFSCAYLAVPRPELLPASIVHAVVANVVLMSLRSRDVIVVFTAVSEDDPARTVPPSGDWCA